MKIETFEIEDATSEASQMACDSEAIELINRLGLDGQKTVMNPETVTRIPYRVMEDIEFKVYKTVCSQACKIEEYRNDPIPLRVLQVAAHAKDTNLFERLEIWSPKAAVIDDPVLIGMKTIKHSESWRNHDAYYLLARWGKTLETFEKLTEVAIKLLREHRLFIAEKNLREAKNAQEVATSTQHLQTLWDLPSY